MLPSVEGVWEYFALNLFHSQSLDTTCFGYLCVCVVVVVVSKCAFADSDYAYTLPPPLRRAVNSEFRICTVVEILCIIILRDRFR